MQVITSPKIRLAESVLVKGVRKIYPSKTMFYQPDDPVERVLYLELGLVKISILSQDGVQKTLCYVEEGHLVSDLGMVRGKPNGCIATAVTECRMVVFSEAEFWSLFHSSDDFRSVCIVSLAEKLWCACKQVANAYFLDRYGKVSNSLVYLARRWGRPADGAQGPVELEITHQELAEFAGVSRVRVTNALDEFEAMGLISKKPRVIVVNDFERLNEWAR